MTDSPQSLFSTARNATFPLTLLAAVASAGVFACANPDVVAMLLSRVQTVEVGDVKIALGDQAFKINSDLQVKQLGLEVQSKLTRLAADLGPREVDRLLHLPELDRKAQGDLYVHCEFERSTANMRYFSAVDHGLAERALVAIVPRADLAGKRETPDFGRALGCYQMELTEDGADVKSLIVSELSRVFHGGFEGDFQKAAPKRENAKTAAARAETGERLAVR
ncbi:hypothetical protein [Methylosinus sp. Sm6]|uniref:hypothetical protein n=1 Tax=Methylosinus sp. Sm6 TaxID=2866948 RepID=UPI001C99EEE3|nr:hypothetical protein [Methylosinus sp. Sm6]MBY6240687.1 hypothetical protein [Methylosinus sp. Sm6]